MLLQTSHFLFTAGLWRQPELKRKLVVDKMDQAEDGRGRKLCREATLGIRKHAREEELQPPGSAAGRRWQNFEQDAA